MKLKTLQSLAATILLALQSVASSSADGMVLKPITDFAEHGSLSRAVTEIIESLEGDTPSATNVIKVTSHDAGAKYIDPFTETIVRSFNGLYEFHIRDYDDTRAMKWTRHNSLLVVSKISPMARIEKFLLSSNFDSQRKLLIVLLDKTFAPLESDIKRMLDVVWRKQVLNVHVVSLERSGDVALQTYFPFAKDNCGQVHPVVWNIYRNATFMQPREHFPRKDGNYSQCSLNVAVFNAPPYMIVRNQTGTIDVDGVDGKLLKTLARDLNFAINYIVVSEDFRWGEIYANQSATGASKLVRSDLFMLHGSRSGVRLE